MENATLSKGYSCSSLWPLDMPKGHLITFASLLAVLSPITIVSNLALVYALRQTKQLGSVSSRLVCILCVSDTCTGLFVLPAAAVMVALADLYRNCNLELAMQYLAFILAYFSFFMLMGVSLDRYIHITKPYRYKQLVTEARMRGCVAAAFVVSCAVAAVSITFPSFVIQVILNVSDLFCILFVFTAYIFVFWKIREHKEKIRKFMQERGNVNARKDAYREISATKTVRVLIVTLFSLFLPYNTSSAVWTYYKFKQKTEPGLALSVISYISYLLVFSNTSANAVIYGLGNTITRKFLKRFVGLAPKPKQSQSSTDGTGCNEKSESLTMSTPADFEAKAV